MNHFNRTAPPVGAAMDQFLTEGEPALIRRVRSQGARTRRWRRIGAAGGALVIVAGGSTAVTANNWFDTTPDGRTYGKTPAGTGMGIGVERQPDLVAVDGDHGVNGYVSKELLNAPFLHMPKSPAEALKEQAEKARNPTVLPVFAADGTTQVDTFTMGKGFKG